MDRRSQSPTPRSHSRILAQSEVTLRIPSGRPGCNLDLIASFRSLDVSAGGVQVGVDRPLRLDALLRMNITVPALNETFRLVGRVVWCHLNTVRQPAWLVGLELMQSSESDLDRWQDSLKNV